MPHFKKHPPRWILVSTTTLQPVARVDDVPWHLIADWCQRVHGATITVKAWSEATTRERSVAGLMRPLYLGDLMAQERVAQQAAVRKKKHNIIIAANPEISNNSVVVRKSAIEEHAEKLRMAWKGPQTARTTAAGGSR